MCSSFKFLVCLLTILHSRGCLGLKDVQITMPEAVIKGREATLQCNFALEGEKLYSLKWYRGKFEFFRYTPTQPEPVKVFPLKGIEVKMPESSPTKIILKNVSREISGQFVCEVTAEKPSFFTLIDSAELKVVEPPKSEPQITEQIHNSVLQAICTSQYSYPAANLTWYINGYPIRGQQVNHRTLNYEHYSTAVSNLRYRLHKKDYPNGKLKLRCSASLYDAYHQSIEVVLHRYAEPTEPPLTTKAPPPPKDYYDNMEDYDNIEYEEPTKLWFDSFFTRSAGQQYLSTTPVVLVLVISNIFS